MSDKPEKLDSTGQPFRTRQRGGKHARRQLECTQRVEAGEYTPVFWWPETPASRERVGDGVPARRADSAGGRKRKHPEALEGSFEGEGVSPVTVPVLENPNSLAPGRTDTHQPGSAKVSHAASRSGLRPTFQGSGSGSSSSLGVGAFVRDSSEGVRSGFPVPSPVPKPTAKPPVEKGGSTRPKSRPKAVPKPPASSPLETSFRVVSDFHGVLDLDDTFTRSAQRVIRAFLQESVFHQFLILSYVGLAGPKSQQRRDNLRTQAAEFQRSLPPNLASRFGVVIVPRKADKARLNELLKPVLFVDDQELLVRESSPYCTLARHITPQYTLEQAIAEAQGHPPSPTPAEWRNRISQQIDTCMQ